MAGKRETFRAGVGLVVTDAAGRVLACERADVPGAWQLPQGGLARGEDVEAAAWRELAEETGLTPDHVTPAGVLDLWLGYELPAAMRSDKTGRGQVHRWLRFRVRPGVELPPLPPGEEREFRASRWMPMAELVTRAVAFRRPAYAVLEAWLAGRLALPPEGTAPPPPPPA